MGQAERVRGSQIARHDLHVGSPLHGIHNSVDARRRWLIQHGAMARPIIEPATDAAERPGLAQTRQGLIDGGTAAQV